MRYLFTSERLGFRNWVPADLTSLQAINSDSEVMEFFPSKYTLEQTESFIQRMVESIDVKGYGYFAVDELSSGNFIGFIGILDQDYNVPFLPATDIGWRLSKSCWGKGYATEGALACLKHAFTEIGLTYIVSVAPVVNANSINVMRKIGMSEHTTFWHPFISKTSKLNPCVCFQITASQFSQR